MCQPCVGQSSPECFGTSCVRDCKLIAYLADGLLSACMDKWKPCQAGHKHRTAKPGWWLAVYLRVVVLPLYREQTIQIADNTESRPSCGQQHCCFSALTTVSHTGCWPNMACFCQFNILLLNWSWLKLVFIGCSDKVISPHGNNTTTSETRSTCCSWDQGLAVPIHGLSPDLKLACFCAPIISKMSLLLVYGCSAQRVQFHISHHQAMCTAALFSERSKCELLYIVIA